MREASALRQLQQGSQQALAWFMDRYAAYVSAVIYHVSGASLNAADLEEVASDVFLILWERAGTVRPESVKAWLGSVARNQARRRCRARGTALPLEEDVLIVDPQTPEGRLMDSERDRLVREAVLAMDQPDREIFLRHYYYGQTVAAVAREMELPEGTVKTRLARGRDKLRRCLSADLA